MTEVLGDDRVDTVRYEVTEGVATITLNRPDKRNALTPPMVDRYVELMRAADDDPRVRAIVLTGAGKGFCSGADLGLLAQGAETLREFLPGSAATADAAVCTPKPVVAAVNGAVAGIGFGLLLGADIRFASKDAIFTTAFARLGLVAEYNASWLLQRLVGLPNAMDLLLSGRTIDADEAHRIGLVQRVVPAGTELGAAFDYARDLAANCSPRSLTVIKQQVYADAERSRTEALAASVELMDASFDWPDLAEAILARQEKRPARFSAQDGTHANEA